MSVITKPLLALLLLWAPAPSAGPQDLPVIGDTTSGIVSLEKERQLGQAFLRSLRSQVPTSDDALLKEYVEHFVYQLVVHSQLQDRRIDIVIIDSEQLNAFAVPGGVVGVNLGLFLHAERQDQIAAILTHELAHLSQRHFARQVDQARVTSMATLAGLLASIVIMATTGGDAGLAAITASQGLAEQSQLRYSRALEAEADRVGIATLVKAGMDPTAMASMFEQLARINRFGGERVPEFLLTHPVTQSRIADAYNQSAGYPRVTPREDLDYQLMRARVQVLTDESPQASVRRLQGAKAARSGIRQAADRYGLALALTRANRYDEAREVVTELRADYPGKVAFAAAEAELAVAQGMEQQAVELLDAELRLSPDNLPLTVQLAQTLLRVQRPEEAVRLLERLVVKRPNDPDLWYQLAETYGQAGDIVGVHQARAEYFVLNGNLDLAVKQLGYALPLVAENFQLTAKINQRLLEIHRMRAKP